MRRSSVRRVLACLVLICPVAAGSLPAAEIPSPAAIPSPEAFLGHRVGADRKPAPWPKVIEYLRAVDAASDRVSIESAGTSTLGNDMPVVVLTSAANQANLGRNREIARRLAFPDGLTEAEAKALVA